MKKITIFILTLLCLSCSSNKKVVAAYLPLWSAWDIDQLKGITHAHISFAQIGEDYKAFIEDYPQYQDNLNMIKDIKKTYPKLKMTIAVGGYGVDGFSDMALTRSSREAFILSVIDIVGKYDLDGVDIDWEFPGHDAWGMVKAREEDRENFTQLLLELRNSLNIYRGVTGKKYELSFAAAAQDWGYNNLEVEKLFKIVDYMNLMSYDFVGNWTQKTGHHSNLYLNPDSPEMDTSIHSSITQYILRGADKEKIVLGIPLYAYGWTGVKNAKGGLFQEVKSPIYGFIDYDTIRSEYVNKGYTIGWDNVAKAAYLYNGDKFITYDNVRSLRCKADYIKENDLGGIMFWEYTQDAQYELIEITKRIFY